MGVVIKMDIDWFGVGRPQVAMYHNCYVFYSFNFNSSLYRLLFYKI